MGFQYQIVYNHFPSYAGNIAAAANALAEQASTAIQARAIQNTVRVDTGAMKGGWRVAQLAEGVWVVYNTQFYAIFHEFGTRFMPASPMLEPAVEEVRGSGILSAGTFWGMVI